MESAKRNLASSINKIEISNPVPYKILSLDGGGAKGFYTLGVLREIEAMTGKKLHEVFNLVFGTSTGAIIAALIAQGNSVDDIHRHYKDHVPKIMQQSKPSQKTRTLATVADKILVRLSSIQLKQALV